MSRVRAAGALLAAGVTTLGGLAATSTPAGATPSAGVVINEVYGGGGNSGATFTNDFVELVNRGSSDQPAGSWSIQYLPASAAADWQVTPLAGTLLAGKPYLIGEAAGAGGTTSLPPTQASGDIRLAATAGTVALVSSTTALTCKTAANCAADSSIVDLVGYGSSAVVREGTPAPAPSNTTSVNRKASADTDDNSADFVIADPTPTGSGSTGGGPGPLRVHDIQGGGWLSPQDDKTVTDVPGIVTAVRSSGSRGYWLQDPNPDDDPATSEGIFVFTGSTPQVHVGDSVLVSGKVSEFYPLGSGETVSTTSNLSITELEDTTATVLSTGNPLPAPVVLRPDTVPDVYAPDLGGGNIEKTPVTPTRSALDFYESIEGMRAEIDDARVVGPSDSFAEQYVTSKPDQLTSYRGGTMLRAENAVPSGRLEVVAVDGSNPQVNVGDVFAGATVGPIDYSRFGGYLIAATTLGTVHRGGLQPIVAAPPGDRQLAIATYNVENLAPDDPASKFQALARGVVTNLAAPDIVALEEVQDNDGATDDGVVAADRTLTMLTDAIRAAGGPSYQWREVDPVNDRDGGQPGGNIRNVFLFNPATVSFVDTGSSSVNRSTTGTRVEKVHGRPALTLSPGRIDPTNPVWTDSRKPVVGQFRFHGKDVFVIANHLDSKLGDQNADGRFQFPAQSSAVQRAGQAQVVHNFVDALLAVDKKAAVAVVGDLNDYQFSPALAALRTGTADGSGPATLTDLITTLPVNQQYTYDFDGISEVLDHILVTAGVRDVHYQVVHLNAEFADQVSDHDPQVVDLRP